MEYQTSYGAVPGELGAFEGGQWRQEAEDVGNMFALKSSGGKKNLKEYGWGYQRAGSSKELHAVLSDRQVGGRSPAEVPKAEVGVGLHSTHVGWVSCTTV